LAESLDMNANNIAGNMALNPANLLQTRDRETPDGWEGVVRQLVSTLRFGVVQITVHESHVVQVERTEKVRFAQPTSQKPNR
jgi:hypothetical protein